MVAAVAHQQPLGLLLQLRPLQDLLLALDQEHVEMVSVGMDNVPALGSAAAIGVIVEYPMSTAKISHVPALADMAMLAMGDAQQVENAVVNGAGAEQVRFTVTGNSEINKDFVVLHDYGNEAVVDRILV